MPTEVNLIKQARIKARLTQRQVSDILSIPLRTIENWESGKSTPPPYVETLVAEKILTIKKERE